MFYALRSTLELGSCDEMSLLNVPVVSVAPVTAGRLGVGPKPPAGPRWTGRWVEGSLPIVMTIVNAQNAPVSGGAAFWRR